MLIFYFVQSRVTMWSTHKLGKCKWDWRHCHNAITTEKPVNNHRSILKILLTVKVVITETKVTTLTNSDFIEMYLFWYVNSECEVKIMRLETVCIRTQSLFSQACLNTERSSEQDVTRICGQYSYLFLRNVKFALNMGKDKLEFMHENHKCVYFFWDC